MFFNSMEYLIFLPVVFAVYYLIPAKLRYLWLLAASYFFYSRWNAKYTLLLLGVTVITYLVGLLQERKRSKPLLVGTFVACFGVLVYFKYFNFLLDNLGKMTSRIGMGSFELMDIILPVGISFFIFQAVGYVIDVYRGDTAAERNFFRYALFVSFFPQLVAGPIERSKNLLHQLRQEVKLDGDNLRYGLAYIIFGVWQKVVIADNCAKVVDWIFKDWYDHTGLQIIIATVLFGIQIYCDFGGYTNIAIGSARILGIGLMRNFDSPYMATSVSDFWRRWHISLTSWFRDYLYIPLGGNRKGKLRKYINTLIVFTVSGMWHGAGWNYIFWGFLNGIFISIQGIWMDICDKNKKAASAENAKVKSHSQSGWVTTWLKRLGTFILVDFAWLFFRASSMSGAVKMILHTLKNPGFGATVTQPIWGLMDPELGQEWRIFAIVACVLVLIVIEAMAAKRGKLETLFFQKPEWLRWIVYFALFFMIVALGVYGEGDYARTEFIYFQF